MAALGAPVLAVTRGSGQHARTSTPLCNQDPSPHDAVVVWGRRFYAPSNVLGVDETIVKRVSSRRRSTEHLS